MNDNSHHRVIVPRRAKPPPNRCAPGQCVFSHSAGVLVGVCGGWLAVYSVFGEEWPLDKQQQFRVWGRWRRLFQSVHLVRGLSR